MLACTALVGCSSNDEPVVDNQKNEINGDAYITVKFSMAGNSATSRAFKDENFLEVGSTSAEATVSSATFYFLDANNQGCADSYTYTGDLNPWTDSEENNASIDETATPIIVIKNPIATPKYIVAVLNANDPLASVSKRPSLAQIQAAVSDYSTQESGKFVMSNSVYVKDSKVITATEILETQIYDQINDKIVGGDSHKVDKDGKDVSPVVIPVERVLAKVTAAIDETAYEESNTTTQGENSAYTIEVEIEGWGLANMTTTSYLVKKLSTSYTNFATNHQTATGAKDETVWWNDAPNTRSYWAESPANVTYKNTGTWTSFATNDITNPLYCQENTTASPTEFVAAATLKLNGNPQTFVRWAGNIHTDTDFINLIANSFQTYVITDGTADETGNINPTNTYFLDGQNTTDGGTHITPAIFGWHYNGKKLADGSIVKDDKLKPYEGQIEVYEMEGYNLAKVTTDGQGVKTYTKVDAKDVQDDIRKQVDIVTLWLDGKTYYYTNIIHNSEDTEIGATDLCAIVRNHLYKLNITGVAGMGTPAPAPDQVIDPETPAEDDESYLAAEIQILSYKVVPTQNVTLQ